MRSKLVTKRQEKRAKTFNESSLPPTKLKIPMPIMVPPKENEDIKSDKKVPNKHK